VNLERAYLLRIALAAALAISSSRGQSESPSPAPGATPFEETIVPTFETQKLARTYVLDIPAPRGLITDRNGVPLAQNRLSYNLAISFPTPLDFSDPQLLSFAREKIQAAEKLLGRSLKISDELIKRHYRNRGILPFEIAQNLTTKESEAIKSRLPPDRGLQRQNRTES
jgi:penicillin-binding protein 2